MADDAATDIVLVGAGPAALFAVFQLGLYGLTCRLIDSLDRPGGQCAVLYPDKPIYDVPGFPEIAGDELTARLLRQIEPFAPRFSLDETVIDISAGADGCSVKTGAGRLYRGRALVLATGLGTFLPPTIEGEAAALSAGPAGEWPLTRSRGAFLTDTERYATAHPGLYAIGDACDYPGKLRLILSAFHEAALMTQAVRGFLQPGKKPAVQYSTSTSGIKKKLGKPE